MGAYINAIGTAHPANRYAQENLAQFMCDHLGLLEDEQQKLKVMYRATGIRSRYSVLDDYNKKSGDFTFYSNQPGLMPFPGTKKRMEVYRAQALPLAVAAIEACLGNQHPLHEFTHLITVSCTGMYAPGLDVDLVKALDLPPNIQRTSLNFMGCYAAMNAIGLAREICENRDTAKVLIVSVELCSLHLQLEQTEDNLLAHSLFGDGAAAAVISGKPGDHALKILSSASRLEMDGRQDMAWQIGDFGFQMALTSYVPEIIKGGIQSLTHDLLSQSKVVLADIDAYAIHPGGKKILEAIEHQLGLTADQNQHAYAVLKEYGNMSSPTVLFVLKDTWQALNGDRDKKILSFAFGPGLTMESLLFKTT